MTTTTEELEELRRDVDRCADLATRLRVYADAVPPITPPLDLCGVLELGPDGKQRAVVQWKLTPVDAVALLALFEIAEAVGKQTVHPKYNLRGVDREDFTP